MKTVFPTALHKLITDHPSTPVIDVRTHVEFAEVHVAAARSVPLDELNPDALGLAKDKPVFLLCRSGQRASKAVHKFHAAGFAHPIVVEGGTLAWIAAGLPVNRGTTKVISLERQVRIVAGTIVFIGVVLAQFVDHRFIWLSG